MGGGRTIAPHAANPVGKALSDPPVSARSFKLVVAYVGTAYQGWQVQANAPTIQAELERAWHEVTGESIRLTASGRTDSGVHALGQVVSLESTTMHSPQVILRAINANLPDDIRILDVEEAAQGFHAIRDAVSKRYRYLIQDGGVADPFLRGSCWYVPQRLDEQAMQKAAMTLTGTHDFASYQAAGSPRASTVRTILDFTVTRQSRELCDPLVIEIVADGFLYNMVRNLVGTLVEVGRGVHEVTWPKEVLESGDRTLAGQTAPPQGLILVSVEYTT